MHVFEQPCVDQNIGRRRIFWTTQQEACGSYELCGNECAIPGLEYEEPDKHVYPQYGIGYRTIKNNNWLLSLILNILNTRARSDLRCPAPSAVYGHWSESYRDDGLWIGSNLWNAAEKPYIRIADSVRAIEAAIEADMQKLVTLEVADSVNVQATYRGRNSVIVTVTALKVNSRHVLNLSGAFVQDTWVWHSQG